MLRAVSGGWRTSEFWSSMALSSVRLCHRYNGSWTPIPCRTIEVSLQEVSSFFIILHWRIILAQAVQHCSGLLHYVAHSFHSVHLLLPHIISLLLYPLHDYH